ncbi:MAG TPA: hypothetical protein VE258_13235, partial [Ktedonobacterales bacterium]|nr:hypothetical protein [Ktedonobacterales bacterium]
MASKTESRARAARAGLARACRWLARGLLALLFLAGAFVSLVPQGRAAARATLLLPALVTQTQPAALVAIGEPVRHTQLVVSSQSGPVFLDIYAPTAGAPPLPGVREAVILISGVGDNRAVPQLINLSESMARAGLVAVQMTTPALLSYTLLPADADAVVVAVVAAGHLPGVRPERVGILGFSAGGALACLAATDPRIQDSLAFITLFGTYYDARSLLKDFGRRALEENGQLKPWNPQLVPIQVLANTIATTLPSDEGKVLSDAFAQGAPPLTPAQIAALSPPAAVAFHLLAGDQPDRVDANIAALSPQMQTLLTALSPSAVVGQLQTPIFLLHDRNDEFVPFTQSRAFDAALTAL